MNALNTVVNREDLEDLVECVQRNTDYLFMAFLMHIHDAEMKDACKQKLLEIKWYLDRVYDPQLAALKRQARMYYQKWLSLKDTDEKTAAQVYREYLKLQCKIKLQDTPL